MDTTLEEVFLKVSEEDQSLENSDAGEHMFLICSYVCFDFIGWHMADMITFFPPLLSLSRRKGFARGELCREIINRFRRFGGTTG